jgi:hypothetical protein
MSNNTCTLESTVQERAFVLLEEAVRQRRKNEVKSILEKFIFERNTLIRLIHWYMADENMDIDMLSCACGTRFDHP